MESRPWLVWLGVLCAGCGSPPPNDLVRIDVPGLHRYAVSTEDGLIAIDRDDLLLDELPIVYPYLDDEMQDQASVVNRADNLLLMRPHSLRPSFSEFGAEEPSGAETLYIQILERPHAEWVPRLVHASLYGDGRFGDLLRLESGDPEQLVAEFPGAGIYARRKGRYVLVGLLAGTLSTSPDRNDPTLLLLPFLGLDALGTVVPVQSDFFTRRPHMFRPDMEHGLTRDGAEPGEQKP